MGAAERVGSVSAVVCNFDGERYLPACLDAVAALEGGVDEVVVVDNASTDGSLALLAERYPQVRVVRMAENAGPAAARNAGMRAARHRWVLALDNDAVPRPDLLVKLRAAAERRPDAVVLQPRSVFRGEPQRVHYDGGRAHFAGLIALRNFYAPLDEAEGQGEVDVDVAVSVCLLVDRGPLLELGGYDETYFILFEDLDLSYRLRLAGHAIVSVEDALCEHDAGTPGTSFRDGPRYPGKRVLYHSRNRWLFLLKCQRWRTLLVAAPALAVYEVAWLGFAIAQGHFLPWCRGKGHVLRLLPQLVPKREIAQARRVLADRDLLVPGPLTVTPALGDGALRRALLRSLDRTLAAWWRLVRRAAG